MVCLPLVGQYLQQEVDPSARDSMRALNRAIAAIRAPFFSDWIALVHTLRRHLPQVGITPLFPRLGEALEALQEPAERPVGLRGNACLKPLEAILALRNETAHGGLPDQEEAQTHLDAYLPVLHQVLAAFDWVGDTVLQVCIEAPEVVVTGQAWVRTLRGVQVGDAVEEVLSDDLVLAFTESPAVLTCPDGRVVPLYPLVHPVTEQEPLYLYDGHYGIQVQTRQTLEERSYVYYLGTHHRVTDSLACGRLRELLARRQISFFLSKEQTAPWTIADSATDYSRRTLEELLGTKYFPACYLPFTDLERHFAAFLRVPPPDRWSAETTRRRYVNGFIVVGLAGAGKTAFLARQVETLLQETGAEAHRENPYLVLFLRGNGIVLRPEGMSLFRDVAEKLGIAVESTTARARSGGGFSNFRDLLEHLHSRWQQDRVSGRCLVLVLDALNEAPFAEQVIREALDMVGEAACYPWCKIVISTRQEWLSVWSSKMEAQETSPLEALRPFLYVPELEGHTGAGEQWRSGVEAPPVVMLEPWSDETAHEVYTRYQAASQTTIPESRGYHIPACLTPWNALPVTTRDLLTNPLYLYLFMATFDHTEAEPMLTVPMLFRQYVNTISRERPGLRESIKAVIAHLLQDLTRSGADLSDDDAHAIHRAWAAALSAEEARLRLDPVQALTHEGMLTKRIREEGGGYRFVFQAVAEYLIYRYLADARPAGETEEAYWTRRAAPARVFPEYAGAFAFLMRDWATEKRLPRVVPLVEASPAWLRDVLTAFLMEQARTGYVPGTGSRAAEVVSTALAETGGAQSAYALMDAGNQLISSRFSLASRAYFQTCVVLYGTLWAANPDNVEIGNGLGRALNNLGLLLSEAGQMSEAEAVYRRSVAFYDTLWRANPDNVEIGNGLGRALNNLGNLLSEAGQMSEAEAVYRRSVALYDTLWRANPDNVRIGSGLGGALNNLGLLLRAAGRVSEVEAIYRRSVALYDTLWRANPDNVEIGNGLGGALNSLGLLLRAAGRVSEAEAIHRRSVALCDTLWRANPGNVEVKAGYAGSLCAVGRFTEAKHLIDEVLALVPEHPYANQLRRYLDAHQG
jgi:tetratricopeptide (TPR) repeat protein